MKQFEIDREKKDEIARNLLQRQYEVFDSLYSKWYLTIQCLAELDVLWSFSKVSFSGGKACRPEFINSEEPYFAIQDMRHPCITPK